MDDMRTFEREIAGVIQRAIGPARPVDAMAVARVASTNSPTWRFQSMFSATKYVVAGAIVALFGGFLLAGVLTQQPSGVLVPPVGASASATAQAEPTESLASEPEPAGEVELDTTPDPLPGVELVTEEVAPGVYRVLGDGVRDITDRVSQVTIDSEGDLWVELLVKGGPRNIVRLGEPGVSLRLVGRQRGTLGMTARGAPVIVSPDPARLFDGEAWRTTELSEYDACWVAWSADEQRSAAGADGACYTSQRDDGELVVRIEADGTRTAFTHAELGLGPEQNGVLSPVVGPDGSMWAAVHDTDFRTGIFEGLVRYDGSAWSFIPYDGDDAMLCGSCFSNLAVDRDGVIWFGRRVDDAAPVLSWDGDSWGSYMQGEGRSLRPYPVLSWPNGDIWFGSDARWDGTTVSLAEPPIPWGEGWSSATAPDGSTWTAIDRQLYIVTPEAVMVAE